MGRDTITVNAAHRHVDADFTKDWMVVKSGHEILVVNEAGDSSTTVYRLSKSTANPRVMAQSDAVLWDGIVGLTNYENGLVTIQHRFAGIKERLPVDEPLDDRVPTLERTELVTLEGDRFPDKIEFTCSDCGKDVSREPHQLDVPGVTPQRCVSCTMDQMSGRHG